MRTYDKGVLIKDCFIAILAGLVAGSIMLFFSQVLSYLSEGNYLAFIIGFIMYILIAIVLSAVVMYIIINTFGKKK